MISEIKEVKQKRFYTITKYKMETRKMGPDVPETSRRECPHLPDLTYPTKEVKGQLHETLSERGSHIGDKEMEGVRAGAGQSLTITIRRQQIEEENRRDRERREREDTGYHDWHW